MVYCMFVLLLLVLEYLVLSYASLISCIVLLQPIQYSFLLF